MPRASQRDDRAAEERMTDLLFRIRARAGDSREVVAGKVGITPAALSAWENKTSFPVSLAQWSRWAKALGVRFEAVIDTAAA